MYHSFDTELAKKYGILEAVLINHFQFWIAKNEANDVNFHDGYYWTFNSIKAFQEMFPYATRRQIETALKHLRDAGILQVGNYNERKYDRTLWYAFTPQGKSISHTGEMESANTGNGLPGNVKPIPDTNTDIDTVKNTDIYTAFQTVYNETCSNLPSCQVMSDDRRRAVREFCKTMDIEKWKTVCSIANRTPFLVGQGNRSWKANIDFLLRPKKAITVIEGGYGESAVERTYDEEESII